MVDDYNFILKIITMIDRCDFNHLKNFKTYPSLRRMNSIKIMIKRLKDYD